jgi:subtilisin family serine protease
VIVLFRLTRARAGLGSFKMFRRISGVRVRSNSDSPLTLLRWGISRCIAILSVAIIVSSVPSTVAAQDSAFLGKTKPQITVGKTGRLKVKKQVATSEATSKPTSASENVVVGPLEINRRRIAEGRMEPFSSQAERFPTEGTSAYVVVNLSSDPSLLEDFRGIVKKFDKTLDVEILDESINGFVLKMDERTAKQVAAISEVTGKPAKRLVDLVVRIDPRQKLSASLREQIKNLQVNHLPQTELETPSTPQVAPAIEKMRVLPSDIQSKLNSMGRVSSMRPFGSTDKTPSVVVPKDGFTVPPPPGENGRANDLVHLVFYLYPRQQTQAVIDKINEVGGKVLAHSPADTANPKINARVPFKRLEDVADMPMIKEVVRDSRVVLHNDTAIKVMLRNPPPVSLPLQGEGQIIGHADTGLDIGRIGHELHRALRGRVKKLIPVGRKDATSDLVGHGTHTAASIVGTGEYPGLASKAMLVHQSLGDSDGGIVKADYGTLFDQAYLEGARVHSNSWGSTDDGNGDYGKAIEVDAWSWNGGKPKDMLVIFASGNKGKARSVNAPATAKNCLTVGASENLRPLFGEAANDAHKLADLSSFGPTENGRTKPEVVAPGTWVASAKTGAEQLPLPDARPTLDSSKFAIDPPGSYAISTDVVLDGESSWHLVHPEGVAFRDYLSTRAFKTPANTPAYVEVWVYGKVIPPQSFAIFTYNGARKMQAVAGMEYGIGNTEFKHWTRITGHINEKHLGEPAVQIVFVARYDTPSPGPIDLYISRVKVTNFLGEYLSDHYMATPFDDNDRAYSLMSGTSMATALVAGEAAIIRESLIKYRGIPSPSAEMIKGIIINTADPIGGSRPNDKSGWGLVNVRKAIESTLLLDDDSQVEYASNSNDPKRRKVRTFRVVDNSKELRVTLVWADPPDRFLLSDLNLSLTSPSKMEYLAKDANGKAPDQINNVEGIDVRKPEIGEWTVTVDGVKLDKRSQKYALVISGDVTE